MLGWSTLRLCCVRSFTVGRNCYGSYVPTNHFILRGKPLNLRPKLSVFLIDVKFAKFKAPKAKIGTEDEKRDHWNIVYYGLGSAILLFGLSYCAVPAYRMFCTVSGSGGSLSTIRKGKHVDSDKIDVMVPNKNRLLKIRFEADVDARMSWDFKPLQSEIWVHPGETALAFYSAKNDTVNPIVGISTYNIVPLDAGIYFSKIQCFCFDEQMLNPGEELDMPVFFYIDPEFENDSRMDYVDEIVLSYTFFESSKDENMFQPFRKLWPNRKQEALPNLA